MENLTMAQVFIRPVHEKKKNGHCGLQRKNQNWWKEGNVFPSVFLCGSWTGVTRKEIVISCVATACPKNLQRDKMNMECCPVKKEEKKSQHTCGGKVSLSLNSKRRIKGTDKWLVPMAKEHVASKQ